MRTRKDIGNSLTGRHLFLCELAGPLAGDNILDLGCGFGWFEEYALAQGCSGVVGVDTDEVRLESARQQAPAASFITGDATALPSEGSYKVIAMFDFLEHLPRDLVPEVLENAALALDKGGRLLVSVPYRGMVSTFLDPAFYFGHRHYTAAGMGALLEKGGFALRRVMYGGGMWEHMSMLLLYVFKWVFAREMPFETFLEKKRRAEYLPPRPRPRPASATMFIEAAKRNDSGRQGI
ncbi:MAG TPA: class I SAM-dependent methyltransferase [Candidatus Anoxymicrobiaceae bacterium]